MVPTAVEISSIGAKSVVPGVSYSLNAIRRLKKETALNVYKERASMRSVQHALGVHGHTLAIWLLE